MQVSPHAFTSELNIVNAMCRDNETQEQLIRSELKLEGLIHTTNQKPMSTIFTGRLDLGWIPRL
jgi:hypothetical protein